MRLTAAVSPCPNDVFIHAGLILGEVRDPEWDIAWEFHELETLNLGAARGRWDLAKISYANFPACAADYALLRCGGALGRGCGPLLLSNGGGWDPGAEVLVPGERTTAHFLLDFFHAGVPGARPRAPGGRPLRKAFLPFDRLYARLREAAPCQGVVIHEMRFTYADDGLRLILDLGAHWEEKTGHPIPLGAMALRRSLEQASPGAAARAEGLIRASLARSRANPGAALELCRVHGQSLSEAVLRSHIDLYVNDFSHDLGPEGEAAVAFFLERQRAFRTGTSAI